MIVRIWRSFSSNNSGSYTLVGRFETGEAAARAALALARLFDAVALQIDDPEAYTGGDPVRVFATENGLPGPVDEYDDDWPAYDERPVQVEQLGTRIVVHHPYTVTLLRQIGEYIYRSGGRVEVELEHTHGHDLALFSFRLPADSEHADDLEAALRRVDGALGDALLGDVAPIVTREVDDDGVQLRFAAAWTDLPAGIRAVRTLAESFGADVAIRVWERDGRWESGDDGGCVFVSGDPLASLR